MTSTDDIRRAASAIHAGVQHGEHYPVAWRGKFTLDEGYRVQLAVRDLRVADGDAQLGWKVGLTAKAIQQMEKFDEPIFAELFACGALASGATLAFETLRKPAFENELCIVLGEPLTGPGVSMAQARAAIATVAPAFEIVEHRGVLSDDPALAIADNLGQKAFVTGAPAVLPAGLALGSLSCAVVVNDRPLLTGQGSAVLDDPANSVAWLANKLAQFGEHIAAGQPIMSGSFTVPTPLHAGDLVQADFGPVGQVTVRIT